METRIIHWWDPHHKQAYLNDLKRSIAAAKQVGAKSVTIHSNALGDGGVVVNPYDDLSDTVKLCSMYDVLLECVKIAEEEAVNLYLEALNITTDHVGKFLKKYTDGGRDLRIDCFSKAQGSL